MNSLSVERILPRNEVSNIMHIAMPGIRILSVFNSDSNMLVFIDRKGGSNLVAGYKMLYILSVISSNLQSHCIFIPPVIISVFE